MSHSGHSSCHAPTSASCPGDRLALPALPQLQVGVPASWRTNPASPHLSLPSHNGGARRVLLLGHVTMIAATPYVTASSSPVASSRNGVAAPNALARLGRRHLDQAGRRRRSTARRPSGSSAAKTAPWPRAASYCLPVQGCLTARCSGRGCFLVLRRGCQSATCRLSVARGSRAAERER